MFAFHPVNSGEQRVSYRDLEDKARETFHSLRSLLFKNKLSNTDMSGLNLLN